MSKTTKTTPAKTTPAKTKAAKSLIGKTYTIPAGTRVTRAGITAKRKTTNNVTVLSQELTSGGKTRIVWKSMGLTASAIIG